MSPNVPQPSKRFLRVAVVERNDVIAHRQRLSDKRDRLVEELQGLDEALGTLDERLRVLNQMVGDPTVGDPTDNEQRSRTPERVAEPDGAATQAGDGLARHVLSGPAIREVAVQVLLKQPEYIEALHYRRWFELLRAAGYAVAGKNPAAVFLTQLTRSPVVRKSTESGVYALDRQAPLRLRQRLDRLKADLEELRSAPSHAARGAEDTRERRHELTVTISQTERALDEALRVLRRDPDAAESTTTAPESRGDRYPARTPALSSH